MHSPCFDNSAAAASHASALRAVMYTAHAVGHQARGDHVADPSGTAGDHGDLPVETEERAEGEIAE